jgi:hypothetical protein
MHTGLMRPRQASRVIKLPQPLDFVRPANPCRIFALLQINHGVGTFDFGVPAIVLVGQRGTCPCDFVGLW